MSEERFEMWAVAISGCRLEENKGNLKERKKRESVKENEIGDERKTGKKKQRGKVY